MKPATFTLGAQLVILVLAVAAPLLLFGAFLIHEDTVRYGPLTMAVALVLLAAAAAVALGRRIVRPIDALAQTARAVASGDCTRRAPLAGARELREVAAEFNAMLDQRERGEARQLELAQRLIETSESERREISRELHDRIGQNVAILDLNLSLLEQATRSGANVALHERLADAQALAETIGAQVRNVMADLRPPALDDYGLLAALRSFADSFSVRTGVAVRVHGSDLAPRPPLATEIALFRIAQEALTNVAKHANAGHAEVTLAGDAGGLELTIADDGAGFEPDRATEAATWGLATMHERTDAIGACLDVSSGAGTGTRITVTLERGAR